MTEEEWNWRDEEEWRDVVGWEGLYQVSNCGGVRALPREVLVNGRTGKFLRRKKGYEMSISIGETGYPEITLTKVDGTIKRYKVHQLVLTAFKGPCPEGMEACHGPDRTPTNISIANLRWDTRSNNHFDRIGHGTNGRRLTLEKVLEIRRRYEAGEYMDNLAAEFSTSLQLIRAVVLRRIWKRA